MAFHNVPPNGFPDLPDMEEVEAVVKDVTALKTSVAGLSEDVSDLNTGKANKADIATEFSDLTNYNAGDLVYYEGDLYEFQVDHTAGAWETSEVIQKDLSDIVTTLKSGLMSSPTDAVKNADYIGTNLLKVIRIGNLVNVSGRFQVETEKPAGYANYLFSNLPIPAGDTVGVHSNTFDNVRLYINASGYLTCNDVAPVGYYNVSATYAVTN